MKTNKTMNKLGDDNPGNRTPTKMGRTNGN